MMTLKEHDPRRARPEDEPILRSRAQLLRKPRTDIELVFETHEVLIVNIAGGRYAVPLLDIVSVAPLGEVVALPGAPTHLAGVTYLRGEVVSVVDLGMLLASSKSSLRAAVVVSWKGERMALGIDGYGTIEPHPGKQLRPTPAGIFASASRYLAGVSTDGVGLLRMDEILAELMSQEQAQTGGNL